MRVNKVKKKLLNGEIVISGWLHIPSTWSAEVSAHSNWDSVVVDMQHGLMSIETAIQMLQSISTTESIPMARANWNDKGSIMKLLDGGVYGVICPMIETKDECLQFVNSCRYPPVGNRSLGPTRPRIYYGQDYPKYANDEILTFAMVESYKGMININDIASVDTLDGIYVGSADLKLSLSAHYKDEIIDRRFEDSLNEIVKVCDKNNITPGIWCPGVEAAKTAIEKGFKFVAVLSDSMILHKYSLKISQEIKTIINKDV